VSLTPPGLTGFDSNMLKEVEEENFRHAISEEALTFGQQIVGVDHALHCSVRVLSRLGA
jgi:hypothetical protein